MQSHNLTKERNNLTTRKKEKATMASLTDKDATTVAGKKNESEFEENTAATTEEEATPAMHACYDPTTTHQLLKVDRAFSWGQGTKIYNDKGKTLFEVKWQGCSNMTPAGPVYTAMLSESETGEPVAYISKGPEVFRETYYIFTAFPNFVDEPATMQSEQTEWYLLGTVRQSVLGKNYVCKHCTVGNEFETTMRAKNGNIRCALLPCMLPFICPRWNLKFYNVNDPMDHPAIVRDQRENTLAVAPGNNVLEAVCISYAVDRLTNPCTRETVGLGVLYGVVGGVAGSFAASLMH